MATDQRAEQYAVCTWSLLSDHETEGAAAIFDQALANGLAAIVDRRWPEQLRRSDQKTRSNTELLEVIESEGVDMGKGVWALPHDGPDELWIEVEIFPGMPDTDTDGKPLTMPNFTEVRSSTLRDAIARTQQVRHAQDQIEDSPLTKADIEALEQLDHDPALFALSQEMIDRAEEGAAREGREEFARAAEYWQALDDEERDRRGQVDYDVHSSFDPKEDLPALQDCPVCGLEAFIVEQFDAYVGEIGIGICAACSYRRSKGIADDEGMGVSLTRAIGR